MRRAFGLLAVWLALVACDPKVVVDPPTQLVLRVHASPDVQRLGAELEIQATGASATRVRFADVTRWPVDLAVVPRAGAGEVEFVVRAHNARRVLLAEDRAIARFVPRAQRVLELALGACGSDPLGSACEPDVSCRGTSCLRCRDGACVPTGREPEDELAALAPDAAVASDPSPDCGAAGCEPLCALDAERCSPTGPERCGAVGLWEPAPACDQFCQGDGCAGAPSCASTLRCGANFDCCRGDTVPGGEFARSYDGVQLDDDTDRARVSPFVLDRFEVTVGRLRAWVGLYDNVAARARPGPGSGATRQTGDTGWLSEWDALLPADQSALRAALAECPDATWRDAAGSAASERLPINCVSWYVAQAFCIWDGGRLPTEAEWNFAAAGGDEQRVYPWSSPHDAVTIDADYAVYDALSLAQVASLSPRGDGKYGHADLAGNVSEWTYDWFNAEYPPGRCDDCANLTPGSCRVLRGGSYANVAPSLRAGVRACLGPGTSSEEVGFRCARSLNEP